MSGWTQEDLDRRNREVLGVDSEREERLRQGCGAPVLSLDVPLLPKPKRGMNKWEAMYEQKLQFHMAVGAILWYKFEAIRFRLADGAYYKPDFVAMMRDGSIDVYEVKGMWREAARVRIKVAADQHPFRFVAVSKRLVKEGGGWSEELFTAALDRLKR